MEEYAKRKRAIYKQRVEEYKHTQMIRDLGPFYRKPKHRDPSERDDVIQSGMVLRGLLHPGAYPHDVDSRRRKSYQDEESLKKGSVAMKTTPLLRQEIQKRGSPLLLRRTHSAPPVPRVAAEMDTKSKWTVGERNELDKVVLDSNQYLLVVTPQKQKSRRCQSSFAWC
jgi:hypothetical protein